MVGEPEGFDVLEDIEVEDLTTVRETRSVMPAVSGLKVRIHKAAVQSNNDDDIKSLRLQLHVVDGIETATDDGSVEYKYKGKMLFTGLMDLVFKADLTVVSKNPKHGGKRREEVDWWKNHQHRVEFSKFCKALELPLQGLRVNDDFLNQITGQEITVDVKLEAETQADADGNRYATGQFRERLKNWAPVS